MNTTTLERRTIEGLPVRASGGENAHITGMAAVFNKLSSDLGGFFEQIAPGAFSGSLGADVVALFNHDNNYILGRTVSKTLRLWEDLNGLQFDVITPKTTWAGDLLETIRRGDIGGCSFGFKVIRDAWTNQGAQTIRTLLEVALFDVSVVTWPAYSGTQLQARSGGTGKIARVPQVIVSNAARYKLLQLKERGG